MEPQLLIALETHPMMTRLHQTMKHLDHIRNGTTTLAITTGLTLQLGLLATRTQLRIQVTTLRTMTL